GTGASNWKIAAADLRRVPDSRFQGAFADDRVLPAGFAGRRPTRLLFRQHLQFARQAEMGNGSAIAARSGPRSSSANFPGARARKRSGISQTRRLFGVCRRLGTLRRKPWRGSGLVQGSVLEIWETDLRDVARGAAGGRHRNAFNELEP